MHLAVVWWAVPLYGARWSGGSSGGCGQVFLSRRARQTRGLSAGTLAAATRKGSRTQTALNPLMRGVSVHLCFSCSSSKPVSPLWATSNPRPQPGSASAPAKRPHPPRLKCRTCTSARRGALGQIPSLAMACTPAELRRSLPGAASPCPVCKPANLNSSSGQTKSCCPASPAQRQTAASLLHRRTGTRIARARSVAACPAWLWQTPRW